MVATKGEGKATETREVKESTKHLPEKAKAKESTKEDNGMVCVKAKANLKCGNMIVQAGEKFLMAQDEFETIMAGIVDRVKE